MNLEYNEMILHVESMPPEERVEFMQIIKELDERLFYQLNPVEWIEDVLKIPRKTIIWSLNEGYEEMNKGLPRVMDDGTVIEEGWDGTPDPLHKILTSLAEWRDVVVESSTGTGKTFIAALVALWFLAVFPNSKVMTLAPKEDLLKTNLWGEIWKFKEPYTEKYGKAEFMALEIRFSKSWLMKGLVAAVSAGEEVSSKTAGFHAEHMLFIMDETQGIDPAILQAVENTCTDRHNLRLALGNPRNTEDPLHALFVRPDFESIRISSYDYPNIVMNNPEVDLKRHKILVPGAVSWKSIWSRRIMYGEKPEFYNDHPTYKALVRGIVPEGSELSLFPEKALEVVRIALEENPIEPAYEEILMPYDAMPLEGFVKIYRPPVNDYFNRYILFGDVAEDKATGDWHACVVLDRVTKEIVALIHMRGAREEYVRQILKMADAFKIYDWRNDKFHLPVVNWERNSGGALHLIPEFSEYPNLYINRNYNNPAEEESVRETDQRGWFTHAKNRPDMIKMLESWGNTLVNQPWKVPDQAIYQEMKTFVWNERKGRYEHMSGKHDDIMMATAGVLLMDQILPEPFMLPPPPSTEFEDPRYQKISQLNRKIARNKSTYRKGGSWNVKKLPRY